MDMNDVYLVVVRLRDWEFMAEASHVNAKKAVRGLAADLQDFYEEGQRSSAAHLMQQGAASVGVTAIEAGGQAPTAQITELELSEQRLELKRKAEDWELELAESRMALEQQKMTFDLTLPQSIQRQKLELAEYWLKCMQAIDPDWRDDKRLCMQAKDRLY